MSSCADSLKNQPTIKKRPSLAPLRSTLTRRETKRWADEHYYAEPLLFQLQYRAGHGLSGTAGEIARWRPT